MTIHLTPTGRVTCSADLTLPLPASAAWGQLRDLPRFAAHDLFHARVTLDGPPRAGARLTLHHQFFGLSARRTGRILRWRDGAGYAFSDLSPHGPRHAFPHTFSYHLTPLSATQSRLTVNIRGRWTLPLLPHSLARLWLQWVFRHLISNIGNDLLAHALHRHAQPDSATIPPWEQTPIP